MAKRRRSKSELEPLATVVWSIICVSFTIMRLVAAVVAEHHDSKICIAHICLVRD